MDPTTRPASRQWVGIAVYLFIALVFSYFFRVDPPAWYEEAVLPAWAAPFKRLLGAFGIFLGAVGGAALVRHFPAYYHSWNLTPS